MTELSALVRSRAAAGAFTGVALGLLAAAGCGESPRPPPLSDFGPSSSSARGDGGGSQLAVDSASVVPTCNLGPEGGVCACVDQPLVVADAPNLYFVLDHSGSMGEGSPQTKWQTVVQVVFNLFVALGPRAIFGVTTFPAGSAGCDPGIPVFPPERGDAPPGAGGPVSTTLLRVLGRVGPIGGTPTAATLQSLVPTLQALPGKTYVILATDGGPNCNSAAQCDTTLCQDNIESAAGCVPDGPNCCVSNGQSLGPQDDCTDVGPTVAGVEAIAALGIPVYVIGIPGSEVYASVLDQLAQAGRTARASEPLYYAVTSEGVAALTAQLSAIAGQITGTCSFTLSAPPDDPTLVNVFFDEQPLPQTDSSDGGAVNWTLDGTTVTVLGDACQRIESGAVLDVRVVAGCPTVLR